MAMAMIASCRLGKVVPEPVLDIANLASAWVLFQTFVFWTLDTLQTEKRVFWLILHVLFLFSSIMRAVIPLAFALGLAVAAPASYSGTTAPPYLNKLAQDAGKLWFGTAADIPGPEQSDIEYMTVLNDTKVFGEITPANYMKVHHSSQPP